jgi:CDP-diacylglycerol--serine O-phosphatidyltransferase
MRITRAVVPSLFTVLNMFSGFLSIIHSSRGEFVPACWLIVLAAGFDALDGVMARLTKSSSAFGVEIDSLSDVVSFGAAPAFMVYQAQLHTMDAFGVLISSSLMVFGGLRLARFNVQLVGFEKDHFVGLPIPMSALTVVAFMLTFFDPGTGIEPSAAPALPWLVAALALLMVSKVKYETLPKPSRRAIQKQPLKFGLGVLAVLAIALTGGKALFPLLILFIAFGVLRSLVGWVRRLGRRSTKFEEEDAEADAEGAEPSQLNS